MVERPWLSFFTGKAGIVFLAKTQRVIPYMKKFPFCFKGQRSQRNEYKYITKRVKEKKENIISAFSAPLREMAV